MFFFGRKCKVYFLISTGAYFLPTKLLVSVDFFLFGHFLNAPGRSFHFHIRKSEGFIAL